MMAYVPPRWKERSAPRETTRPPAHRGQQTSFLKVLRLLFLLVADLYLVVNQTIHERPRMTPGQNSVCRYWLTVADCRDPFWTL